MLLGWKQLAEQGNPDAQMVVHQNREHFAAPTRGIADTAGNPKLRGTIQPPAPEPSPTVLEVSALGPGLGTMATRFARTGAKTVARPLDQAYGMDAVGL
jgi:hypothetical protein